LGKQELSSPPEALSKRGWRRFFTWKKSLIFGGIILSGMVLGVCAIKAYGATLDLGKLKLNSTSYLFDRTNKRVDSLGNVRRNYRSMNEIRKHNPDLPRVFELAEDKDFRSHLGVNWWRMFGAAVANISSGEYEQGGGTFNMQLARNLLLNDSRKTLSRKAKEMLAALIIDSEYTKDEILATWLNCVDFGPNVTGIDNGIRYQFNRTINDKLEPHQMALLAALPQNPTKFSKKRNEGKLKRRRDRILDAMEKDGLIKNAEVYKQKPLTETDEGKKEFKKTNQEIDPYKDMVLAELKERFDAVNPNVHELKVYTSLDLETQKVTNSSLNRHLKLQKRSEVEGGSITLNSFGEVMAVGGGEDFKWGDLNQATSNPMPCGSIIKPLTTFGPAFDKNADFNESTPVKNAWSMGGWHPRNAYRGLDGRTLPCEEILIRSLNQGTLRVLTDYVGLETAVSYGEKLGLEFKGDDRSYAAVGIGGFQEGGPTPVALASAYTAFTNEGIRSKPRTIQKVEKRNAEGQWEEVLPNDIQPKEERVFKVETARRVNRILQKVNTDLRGTAHYLHLAGSRPFIAKTGTTNGDKESTIMLGTAESGAGTGRITVVMFHSKKRLRNDRDDRRLIDSKGVGYTAQEIMNAAHHGVPIYRFARPAKVYETKPIQNLSLEGGYDELNRLVQLSWTDQGPDVRFELYERVNGKATLLGNFAPGSTSYQSRQLLLPEGAQVEYVLRAIDNQGNKREVRKSVVIPPKDKNLDDKLDIKQKEEDNPDDSKLSKEEQDNTKEKQKRHGRHVVNPNGMTGPVVRNMEDLRRGADNRRTKKSGRER
jgi:penicillin-binding protein 2A